MRRRVAIANFSSDDEDTPESISKGEADGPSSAFHKSLDEYNDHPSDLSTPSVPTSTWLALHRSLPSPLSDLVVLFLSFFGQLALTWNEAMLGLTGWWTGAAASGSQLAGKEDGVEMEKKKVRRRRRKADDKGSGVPEEGYFPGMVNLSGTLCYMNSVLQAFASITSLVKHLETLVELAVEADVPTPVTDALLDVIQELNTPHSRAPPALRPHELLHALQTLPAIRRLLSTREQQDAHELFIVLAEAVSNEAVKVAAEISMIRGLGDVLSLQGYTSGKNVPSGVAGHADTAGAKKRDKIRAIAQPWEGLFARRRMCQTCGWSENIRLDTLGGMELPIPLQGDVTLEACIAQYLAPEQLSDVTCEMCSLKRTLSHYRAEAERLSAAPSQTKPPPTSQTASGSFSTLEGMTTIPSATDDKMTNSRKKRSRDARRVETRLQEMLDSGVVSHFGEPLLTPTSVGSAPISIKWQTVRTDSIRQGIVTRPPQTLRLLLIRSEFTPYGALLKKTARIRFPMILDLTGATANGVWEERGSVQTMLRQAAESEQGAKPAVQRRILYRLESAILHYGYTHSSGHYICIRRKPTPELSTSSAYRPAPVTKSCPDGCRCESCVYFGQVREGDKVPGRGWLRISDADVDEVGEEALYDAAGAVFMLFYEKVGECETKRDTSGADSVDHTGHSQVI
ncbi:hypothetical protein IAU60_004086 [Kwoniella sp. DSM 27419]